MIVWNEHVKRSCMEAVVGMKITSRLKRIAWNAVYITRQLTMDSTVIIVRPICLGHFFQTIFCFHNNAWTTFNEK